MTAVYQRELRSYFTSVTGPVFIAFIMLFVGIYFIVYNVVSGVPNFGYALYGVSFIFMLSVPILTMRSFSEEQKNRTDQLLLTSPASPAAIVLGKYLAMLTVMAIVCAICCVCPLIIKAYGSSGLASDYACILAFFLLGAAYISIGMFLSALTENQIVAAVTSIGVFFVIYYIRDISGFIGSSALESLVAFGAASVVLGLAVFAFTKSAYTGFIVGILGCIAVLGVYLRAPGMLEDAFPRMLAGLSLIYPFSGFVFRLFDWSAVVLYVSVSVFFTLLTVLVLRRRSWA
ncbi:MAG: ABC transporter permease [Lachnospiraceae bacterium]|nr:ABC transporter permease [Lachnospiraceae bacterium]